VERGPFGHSLITINADRNETVYDGPADSLVSRKFESRLEHYGRIIVDEAVAPTVIEVLNDSLRLFETHPFRISVFMSRDTLYAVSGQRRGAALRGDDKEKEMLECLFEGRAASMSPGDGSAPPQIDHFKSACPGGLYGRLDLPVILGSMIVRIPPDQRRVGAAWRGRRQCPSFSGLGLEPLETVDFEIEEGENTPGTLTLVFSAESVMGNTKTDLPNGETATVIGGHYRWTGRLVVFEDSWLCLGGSFVVTEDMSYVRPALSPTVLEKTCETSVSLTVVWDS
jgi:hypothetical protein